MGKWFYVLLLPHSLFRFLVVINSIRFSAFTIAMGDLFRCSHSDSVIAYVYTSSISVGVRCSNIYKKIKNIIVVFSIRNALLLMKHLHLWLLYSFTKRYNDDDASSFSCFRNGKRKKWNFGISLSWCVGRNWIYMHPWCTSIPTR